MQSPKMYVGVHSDISDPAGAIISLGTQAALKGDWILGPRHPATHAFVVMVAGDYAWRLDGRPKTATWTPCSIPPWTPDPRLPVAVWQIQLDDAARARAAIRARAITGAAYDWAEIVASAGVAFAVLPGLQQWKWLGRSEGFHSAMICTQVARNVLMACGGPLSSAAAALEDLFPERLGQMLRGFEASALVARVS